jgi:hypothetical protein
MPLVEHDDVIETLLAKGPSYPFGDRIRQRRPIGRSDLGDASTGELVPEVIAIHVVPVMNQVSRLARSSIKRKPSTGAGAYQGRARQGVHDPDRLLPPFNHPEGTF